MKNTFIYLVLAVLVNYLTACNQSSENLPQIKAYPVNSLVSELEQLYRLDLLPQYRPGIIEQESSYDRTGGNDDGFSGKYSFIRKEGKKLVLADFKGPGVINRIWTPTPTRDTIQFYFDGETIPRISIPFIDLFSGKVFPFVNPVCGNEVGGYYCYLPIQFAKSCKIMYCGELIQFHQIQCRPYPEDSSIQTYTPDWSPEAKAALEKACHFWNSETSPIALLKEQGLDVKEEAKQFFIAPGESVSFFHSKQGGRIVGIEIESGSSWEGNNKDVLIQASWDGNATPAINAPAADFFGYAFGKPAMRNIMIGNGNHINYCYIPMPFEKNAELKFEYKKRDGEPQSKMELKTKVYYLNQPQNPQVEGRLYTVWRREINPKEGNPYLFAQLEDKGHYIGTVHQAQGLNPGMTRFFEGDDSTAIDGKMRMHGTGSEDYYNGGWYALLDRWDRGVSLPIHGSLDYSLPMARTGGYRFYLTDKMTFEKELFISIEHGAEMNNIPVDYTSVAFYYGSKPSQSAVEPTTELRTINDPKSHIFYPQLMDLTLGESISAENKGRIELSTNGEGMIRIMFNEIPEGRYKVYLSYTVGPDQGEFSIWNRQKLLADWKNSYAEKESRLDKQEIGELRVTPQTNSISIRIKKTVKGGKFRFGNIYLEKL